MRRLQTFAWVVLLLVVAMMLFVVYLVKFPRVHQNLLLSIWKKTDDSLESWEQAGLTEVYILDPNGNRELLVTIEGSAQIFPSPNGTFFAYVSYSGMMTWTFGVADFKGNVLFEKEHFTYYGKPSWSADGKKVAMSILDRGQMVAVIYVYDVETAKERLISFEDAGSLGSTDLIWFDNDQSLVLILYQVEDDGRVYQNLAIMPIDRPAEITLLTKDHTKKGGLQWLIREQVLAFQAGNNCIRTYNFQNSTEEELYCLLDDDCCIWEYAVALDSETVAFRALYRDGGDTTGLYVFDITDRLPIRISPENVDIGDIDWSPDGKWIAADTCSGCEGGAYLIKPNGQNFQIVSDIAVVDIDWLP